MISVETIDDILFDLEGSRAADVALAGFPHPLDVDAPPEKSSSAVTDYGPVAYYVPPHPRLGGLMIDRCAVGNRSRYRTLLHVEKGFPPDGDYGMLIVTGCQILETELHDRLLESARPVCASLVEVLRNAGDKKQAALLEKWGAGELPATIGICCIVTLAFYRGVDRGDRLLTNFLRWEFCAEYLNGLRNNALGRALDQLRTEFRNPACHGSATFDSARYAKFVDLLVTRHSFNEFDAEVILSDAGLLVTHLLHHTGGYAQRKGQLERQKQLCRSWLWGTAGPCPKCELASAWDGTRCMNCHHGMW